MLIPNNSLHVDQPLAYVQDHIFDSAPGTEPTYFGHNDMAELYSRSETAFPTPPRNNYTATVIEPDGVAFADFSAAVSMYAYEKFQTVHSTCEISSPDQHFDAFFWFFANSSDANTTSFDNTTFAQNAYDALAAQLPVDVLYNSTIHTPVPGLNSRFYYGGYGNPPLNAVLKFWLCNDNQAVSGFRRAQKALIAENNRLKINLSDGFVLFTRSYLVYDRQTETGFSHERAVNAVLADQFRGDVAGPPVDVK
ncbi:hypothetical protein KCU83_g7552, partial [Aureobasidium melanogenum]